MRDSEIIATLVILTVVVLLCIGGCMASETSARDACETLGEDTGSRTQYKDDACFIEIAPDLFVNVNEIKYYLDHVEPVRGLGE